MRTRINPSAGGRVANRENLGLRNPCRPEDKNHLTIDHLDPGTLIYAPAAGEELVPAEAEQFRVEAVVCLMDAVEVAAPDRLLIAVVSRRQ